MRASGGDSPMKDYGANKTVAIAFAIIGIGMWLWPGFNGYLFAPSGMTIGESRIISAVFIVGAAIVSFQRPNRP